MAGELIPCRELKPLYKMKEKTLILPNIAICVLLDLVGMASYALPFLGEFSDVVWAPISAIIFNNLFGGRLGMIGGVLNFLEELVPFTDVIPSFTIAWFIRKRELDKEAAKNIVLRSR
jgi:hypothetical protein